MNENSTRNSEYSNDVYEAIRSTEPMAGSVDVVIPAYVFSDPVNEMPVNKMPMNEAPVNDVPTTVEPAPEESRPAGKKLRTPKGLNWWFFPAAMLYHELLLHAFDTSNDFLTWALVPMILFAVAGGAALRTLLCFIPKVRTRRIVSGILCGLWMVLVGTEYCLKNYFKIYFGVGYIMQMTTQVVGDFGGTMVEVILARIPFILLDVVPFVLLLVWGKPIHSMDRRSDPRTMARMMACLVICQMAGSLWGNFGPESATYRADYTTDAAVPRFGLLSTIRLEAEYAVFGVPQMELTELNLFDEVSTDHPERVTYGFNKMNIDFQTLSEQTDSTSLKTMYQYFSTKTASQKNEYTGMFQGKNLILITAESFSQYVISEELTPTLYKLTHSGFVFTESYQPGWGQSTTGGEYAVMTGLIPTWVNNELSFYASSRDYMPFALGNQFSQLGYSTKAYHNNTYNYYNRDKTHPNLGYDYVGVGTGLKIDDTSSWPYSDLEMVQNTLPEIIQEAKRTGQPFHTYYMTVSAHANWNWGNAMSARHRAEAEAAYPNASQTVQGYVAANLELEAALTYMLDQLEQAGVLDDTVICMAPDHYPYAMVTDSADYYNELRGFEDTERDSSRYRNTIILWNSAMDTVTVNTPCSTIDIIPTLSNLFGLEFDSRLLSGHDIFATNYTANRASTSMPLVILPGPDGSRKNWITAAGSYNAYTGEFTPNAGVIVDATYVEDVNRLVDLQYTYAKALIQYDFYNLTLGTQQTTPEPVQTTTPEPTE